MIVSDAIEDFFTDLINGKVRSIMQSLSFYSKRNLSDLRVIFKGTIMLALDSFMMS